MVDIVHTYVWNREKGGMIFYHQPTTSVTVPAVRNWCGRLIELKRTAHIDKGAQG